MASSHPVKNLLSQNVSFTPITYRYKIRKLKKLNALKFRNKSDILFNDICKEGLLPKYTNT